MNPKSSSEFAALRLHTDEKGNIRKETHDQERISGDRIAQAKAILGQVHYYFSDENLAKDSHLRAMMKGHENKPVDLHKIHSFKKMRQFQPFEAVVDALKSSEIIDIIEEGSKYMIRRKVPYLKPLQISQKKLPPKPTGFEEYYSDAPLTPAEHADERSTYDPDCSFAMRIETAIQKFQAKRKFQQTQEKIFNKFLKFGGITTGPKQFTGGLDADFIKNATSAELAWVKATSFVDDDKYVTGENRKWDVMFERIAKAFLSSVVPAEIDYTSDQEVKMCTDILRNFYNYILYHEVCPEYTTDIFAARAICNLAEKELFKTRRLGTLLPGDFNKACSALFGGFYHCSDSLDGEGVYCAISDKHAKRIVAYGMAAYGSAENYYGKDEDIVRILTGSDGAKPCILGQKIASYENDGEPVGLEVVDTIYPDAATLRLYDPATDRVVEEFGIKPLGKLICRPWKIPTFTAPDLPRSFVQPTRPELYEFWLEEQLLELCFTGMKLEAVVAILSGARTILDRVSMVHCSFYTLSTNELLLLNRWKEPRMYTREEMDKIYDDKADTLQDSDQNHEKCIRRDVGHL